MNMMVYKLEMKNHDQNDNLPARGHSEAGNRKLFTLPSFSFSMGTPHVPLEDKETLSAMLEKLRIHLCV